ncbi:hypothetical protein ABK040_003359 [Willaertia magna]
MTEESFVEEMPLQVAEETPLMVLSTNPFHLSQHLTKEQVNDIFNEWFCSTKYYKPNLEKNNSPDDT